MSRAFTKEDDAGAQPFVKPRAPLPDGTPNYVTPNGLGALREELARLVDERAKLERGDLDRSRAGAAASLGERIAELEVRLAAAVLVDPKEQPRDEVRFGARVTLRSSKGTERRLQIVGVDEADAAAGRIAFVAPLSRALFGKKAGDVALVRTPNGEEEVEVVAIAYADDDA